MVVLPNSYSSSVVVQSPSLCTVVNLATMATDMFVPRRTGQLCGGHVKVLPKSSAVVAMLLLLSDQAQGFASAPAFLKQRPCGSAPTLPSRHSHEHASDRSNSIPRRRPRGWVHGEEGGGGEFRQCRRAATSRLWMANPEGTQQFRDRDLEFMFYDEAEVMLCTMSYRWVVEVVVMSMILLLLLRLPLLLLLLSAGFGLRSAV